MKRMEWLLLSGTLVWVGCDDDGKGVERDAAAAEDAAVRDAEGWPEDAPWPDAGVDAEAQADAAATLDAGDDMASLVERGHYLVHNVGGCSDCHTPRAATGAPDLSKFLAGNPCMVDADPTSPDLGCLSSRNLTNHETGLKNRSNQEIKDMFLKGERPDGKFLHPIMPYYALGNMSERDADAIVAYLRTVPGVDHMLPPNQPPFDNLPAAAPRWPENLIPQPRPDYPEQEAAKRGRYLAGNVGICMECHTPSDAQGNRLYDKAFQGGNAFPRALLGLPDVFPEIIFSANVTPHATGIAGYTVEDVIRTLREGIDKNQDNSPLCPPMPAGPMSPLAGLTDGDAQDIAHYLLSLPPVDNAIPVDCRPPAR